MILPHLKEKSTEKDQDGDNQFPWGNKVMKICFSRIRQGCLWFWKDFKKPHLLWVKLIFMLQSASLVTLYPYLIVHLRSLGFTIEDASIVNTAVPLADVIAPPAAGFLADKIGNFRVFMSVLTFLNGVSSLFLLTVNKIEPTIKVSNFSALCCVVPQADNTSLCYLDNYDNTSRQSDSTDSSNGILEGYYTCLDRNGSFEPHLLTSWNATYQNDCINTSCSFLPLNTTTKAKGVNNWLLPTFWHYLGVRVLLDIFRASSLMLFEGALVAIIKEQGGDYGLQKLFGTLGAVIFGPLSGQLIDLHQKYGNSSAPGGAYMPVILLYFILRTITAGCLLKVNLDFKPPAQKVAKNVWQVMRRFEVLAFLGAFLVSGILWGFLENFLFWLLEDLGSTKFLMGISLAVGTLAGLPLTLFSSLLIKKLGFRNIMTISLFLYAIRLLGYSLLATPEWILLFEALKPFCTTLLLIAVFMFIKNNSPLSAAATVESIFGSSYFGVGRGIGGLVGGFSIERIGIVFTFRLIAITAAVTAVIYGTLTEARRRWGSGKYPLMQEPAPVTKPTCAIISFTMAKENNKEKDLSWLPTSPGGISMD